MGCRRNNGNNGNVAGAFDNGNNRGRRPISNECERALELIEDIQDLLDDFFEEECDRCRKHCCHR